SSAHEESKEGIRLWNELGRTRMEFENLALEIACAAKHVSEEFVKTEEAAVACNDTLQTAQGMIDALAILSSQTRQDEWKNQLDTAVTAAQEMVRLSTIVNEYAKQIEARPANAYTTVSEMDSPPPQHVPNSDDAGEAMPLLLHEPRHSRVI
ncbi:MAG: hypothetical protein K0U29_01420, partial [Gammaproteobacteria bacterium]|nr:hypothetical protein [Gammaproteobacteria bacterium]